VAIILPDGFGRPVNPIRVSQQREQLDGAEKLHRVWPGLPQDNIGQTIADYGRDFFDSSLKGI
jgi:hypothetical protein